MCERLHCLPGDLDGEDVLKILRDLNALDLYRNLQRPVAELSDQANAAVGRALQLEIDDRRARNQT